MYPDMPSLKKRYEDYGFEEVEIYNMK